MTPANTRAAGVAIPRTRTFAKIANRRVEEVLAPRYYRRLSFLPDAS